jgi:3-oxoacyl-[acyl-carrier protein] reductase
LSTILKDKVAVITGSGQGIGRAVAIEFARAGAKVVTNNRKPGSTGFALLKQEQLQALSPEKRDWVNRLLKEYSGDAETTAKTIREFGGEATPFFGDVAKFDIAAQLIQTAVDHYGKIDILVNVAGTFGFSPVHLMSEETWDHVAGVKPKAYFNTIRHAVPYMMKQKWGRIINCTSQSWAGDILKHCEYAAANAGAVGLTRAVANELYPFGITCNAFGPFARTRASFELEAYKMGATKETYPQLNERRIPFETTPGPEHIGPPLVFLVSDQAAHISGSVFSIGGNTIGMFADPVITKSITRSEGVWTVEELMQKLPTTILNGYHSRAENP